MSVKRHFPGRPSGPVYTPPKLEPMPMDQRTREQYWVMWGAVALAVLALAGLVVA